MPVNLNPGSSSSQGGTAVETHSMEAVAATDAGENEGTPELVKSLNEDFSGVAITPTDTAPRFKLILSAGRVLDKVIDPLDGDITSDFSRVGSTQDWLSDIDFDSTRVLFVGTTST